MRRRDRRRRGRLLAAAALTLLLGACGGDGDAAEEGTTGATVREADGPEVAAAAVQTFVGKVTGTDAFVAVQTTASDALVYVCDGQKIWSLFEGSFDGSSIRLADPTGAEFAAAVSDGSASGTVTFADGVRHAFEAELAAPPAGLFVDASRSGDQVTLRGWVRIDDDEVRGKTVELAGLADASGPDVTGVDDGGTIPPTAEAEPVARRVSLIKCALGMMNFAKAKQTAIESPTAANLAAREAAAAAAATACGNPGTAAS